MRATINRRKFLTASGVVAATAIAAEAGGDFFITKQVARKPGNPVKLVAPSVKPKPLPADVSLNVPGLSPFFTPEAEFYRVDTAFTVPQLTPSNWQLRIHGMVDNPMTVSFDELMKQPMLEHDITLTCVSESVGGGYIGNARWQGTLLAPLLRKAGIQAGADQIVMRDMNGMTIGVATDPVLDGRESMLAIGMNGQTLPPAHGYPVRVVVPGLYGYVSACKWVVDMELTTFAAFDAYWTKRGWSEQAPIKNGVPHRRAEKRPEPGRGQGHDRGRGLGAAPRHRGRRGVHRRHLVSDETVGTGQYRYLAPVVLRLGRFSWAAHHQGARHGQDRPYPDLGCARTAAQRRHRLPHDRSQRYLSSVI